MTTAPQPPAGWYSDPKESDQLRWWDGMSWTEFKKHSDSITHIETRAPRRASQASSRQLSSPTQTATASDLATLGDRLLAALLDGVFTFALYLLLAIIFPLADVLPGPMGVLLAVTAVIGALALLIISTVIGEGRIGQSYGKHLMGLKMVRTPDRVPIGSPSAFVRGLVRSIGAYPLGLGLLWMLWDPQRQGWHDKASSTIVVKDSRAEKMDPAAYVRTVFEAQSAS